MQRFSSIIITAAFTLTLFSSVLYTSCEKEPIGCKGVVCYNGGSCIHGICTCPVGYEGRQCEQVVILNAPR